MPLFAQPPANPLGVAGSDAGSCGVVHGAGLFYELELMERAGLSPASIISSATGTSSNWLAFKDKFGKIKPAFEAASFSRAIRRWKRFKFAKGKIHRV